MTTLPKTLTGTAVTADGILGFVRNSVTVWLGRHRSRSALARLDAHLLRDIGLEPERAQSEAALPFWRP
ncbi:MAG: DUF1127 domain-containing protein [Pseudomonadota bacterium]